MANDGTGVWLGDGSLDGTLRFDSIQLSYDPDDPAAATTGVLYIDDLRLVTVDVLGIESENRQLAGEYILYPNYPNPFNPTTTVSFTLPAASGVHLDIYNVKGEKVRALVNGYFSAGNYSQVWDGKNSAGRAAPSGVYMLRMISDGGVQVRNMLLLK
jgi:hypothetical protein